MVDVNGVPLPDKAVLSLLVHLRVSNAASLVRSASQPQGPWPRLGLFDHAITDLSVTRSVSVAHMLVQLFRQEGEPNPGAGSEVEAVRALGEVLQVLLPESLKHVADELRSYQQRQI